MTNCVVMDCDTLVKTFNVASGKLVSHGYNVIMQGSTNPITWLSANGDIVLPPGTTSAPLILDEGIYKVPLSSPAYRHLPSSLAGFEELQAIEFPLKDLTGEGIDYSCLTHSGAWQQTYLAEGETEPDPECEVEPATSITLTSPVGTVFTENDVYTITADVEPGNASKVVTWTSSDITVATIVSDGVNVGKIRPLKAGKTFITAISMSTPSVKDSVEIEVFDYIHVTDVQLTDTLSFYMYYNNTKSISYSVLPDNANNKKLTWTLNDPTGTLTINTTWLPNTVTIKFNTDLGAPVIYAASGTATLTATAEDGSVADSCKIEIGTRSLTDGVFLLCEGNYSSMFGSVNYLRPDGVWDDNIVMGGVTGQFGTIYKNYFAYIVKQNRDLTFYNATDMQSDAHGRKNIIPDGDPRSFVGVDENTGYLSSSNGIYIFSLNFPPPGEVDIAPTGYITDTEGDGVEEGHEADSEGGLYTGQVGTMVRAGNYVFALHQRNGLLVIDPTKHQIVRTITGYPFNGLVLAGDGYLWSGAGGNKLLRIDPWTLDLAEVTMSLPSGAAGTIPTAWGVWRIESLMADPLGNGLYCGAGGDDGMRFGPAYFYRYDIDADTVATVLNLTTYDNDR